MNIKLKITCLKCNLTMEESSIPEGIFECKKCRYRVRMDMDHYNYFFSTTTIVEPQPEIYPPQFQPQPQWIPGEMY